MTQISVAQRKIREWRLDAVLFVREVFGVEPDAWQVQALRAFSNQDNAKFRISMQACVGPGKSAVLAWCGWNFLLCYGEIGNHPKGAAVSVTADNLKDNLWPEFSKWQSRSPILMQAFKWTKERIFSVDHPETWFLSARSYSKSADPEEQGRTLSGLHSKYVLALIDESGEIPTAVAKAAEQALSERDCSFGRILQAGNPSSLDGLLYAAATTLSDLWHVIRITGDPDDPNRSPRIDIEWARQQIKQYGRDDPWVMYSILGLFPPSSINALLGPDDVMKAIARNARKEDYEYVQKRLGVDVARFGADRTILGPRQGLRWFKPIEMRGVRTQEIVARVLLAHMNWKQEMDFVDGTGGYGAGVVDGLIVAGRSPFEYNASSKASDPRFYNLRAECWWRMAEAIKRGASLPEGVTGLQKELCAPTYTFKNGKILIEDKDQIKKRLGFSPDIADSYSMTYALPDMPASTSLQGIMLGQQAGKSLTEFDPFRD
jgi:phage terminase large subunit